MSPIGNIFISTHNEEIKFLIDKRCTYKMNSDSLSILIKNTAQQILIKIKYFQPFLNNCRAKHERARTIAKLIACTLKVEGGSMSRLYKRKRNPLRRSLKIIQIYLKILTQSFLGSLITDLHSDLKNLKQQIQYGSRDL